MSRIPGTPEPARLHITAARITLLREGAVCPVARRRRGRRLAVVRASHLPRRIVAVVLVDHDRAVTVTPEQLPHDQIFREPVPHAGSAGVFPVAILIASH